LILSAGFSAPLAAETLADARIAQQNGDYATALRIFQEFANRGNTNAQTDVGDLYSKGLGVTQNFAEALRWYSMAAQQGNPAAEYRLGYLYYSGRGVPKDFGQAATWYRKAAERGYANAQYMLGVLYDKGLGVAPDANEAAAWYGKAAAQGNANAQNSLQKLNAAQNTPPASAPAPTAQAPTAQAPTAQAPTAQAPTPPTAAPTTTSSAAPSAAPGTTLEDGVAAYNKQDYAAAFRIWQPLAEQGNAYAQTDLGVLYENGLGVPQNNAEAIKWYRKAAAQGNVNAQSNLNALTAAQNAKASPPASTSVPAPAAAVPPTPPSPPSPPPEAAAAEPPAEAAPSPSMGPVGTVDEGVAAYNNQDYTNAFAILLPLAEAGNAVAQRYLGILYEAGAGVAKDKAEATNWYRKAADQGDAEAQKNLAAIQGGAAP
jgi:hypothetical protein